MAKAKTKLCPMDTKAALEDSLSGIWTFQAEGFTWFFQEGAVGVNTGMVLGSGKRRPMLYSKSLDLAVMYAWGFVHGFNEGTKLATAGDKEGS